MIVGFIPAAGLSARMGRPKPLLDVNGRSMLAQIIEQLRAGGAETVVVVTPPAGRAEAQAIRKVVDEGGAVAIVPDHETADMRASIELGLLSIESRWKPEGLLLTPCDMPGLRGSLVRAVIEASKENPGSIIVPRSPQKRGHPVYLPWPIALKIRELPQDKGVKHMFENDAYRIVELACVDRLEDIDSPEDYQCWKETESP